MADKKISQLTAATLPLAGTEVLPIVQSGVTVKVASNDLTVKNFRSNATTGLLQIAGPGAATTRVMTTPDANFTAARTDAGQTFTGQQIINGNLLINTTGVTGGLNGDVINLFGTGTVRSIIQTTGQYAVLNMGSGGSSAAPTTTAYGYTDSGGNAFVFGTGSNTPMNIIINGSTVASFTTSGNLAPIAGKGIDFSANANAPGMTSELLNWYEEGTFTPTFTGLTVGNGSVFGYYRRIGKQVFLTYGFILGSTSAVAALTGVSGFPFTTGSVGASRFFPVSGVAFEGGVGWYGASSAIFTSATSGMGIFSPTNNAGFSATVPFTWGTDDSLSLTATYFVD